MNTFLEIFLLAGIVDWIIEWVQAFFICIGNTIVLAVSWLGIFIMIGTLYQFARELMGYE